MFLKTAILFAACYAIVLAEEKKEARSASYPKEDFEDASHPVQFPGSSHSSYSPADKGLKTSSSHKSHGTDGSYPEEQEIPSYLVQENKNVPSHQRNELPTLGYPSEDENNNGDYDQQQINRPNLLFPSGVALNRPFPQYPSETIDGGYVPQQEKIPGPNVVLRPIPTPAHGPKRPEYPEETDDSYGPVQKLIPGHIGVVPRPPHHLRPQVHPPFRPVVQPHTGYGFAGRPRPMPGHGFVSRPQPGQGFGVNPQPDQGFVVRPQPGQGYGGNPQPGQGFGGNPIPALGFSGNVRPGKGIGGNPHHGQGFGGNPHPGQGFGGNSHTGQGFGGSAYPGHGLGGNSHRLEDVIPGTPGKDYPTYSVVPTTSFHCQTEYPGFYADMEAGCQVWHYCQLDGRHDSFLCPNGTLFNQKYFVCDWWYNVDCAASRQYYPLNAKLYKEEPKPYQPRPELPRPGHNQHGTSYPQPGPGYPISVPRPSHQHGTSYPQPGPGYPISVPRPSHQHGTNYPQPRPAHHLNPTFKGLHQEVHQEVPEDEIGYRAVKKSTS